MRTIVLGMILLALCACAVRDDSNAWGNFEAEETVLSARTSGNITEMLVTEGDTVQMGDVLAVIDTTDLALSKAELESNIALLELKILAATEKQRLNQTEKANMQVEERRFTKLMEQDAATRKQLDDIEAGLRLIDNKLALAKTEISMAKAEKNMAVTKLETLKANIAKCYVKAPSTGTVLSIYSGEGEFLGLGKPVLKLGNMQQLKAVFFISGKQLKEAKLQQEISLRVDGSKGLQTYPATISYISDKAEFTPKVIQTREERTKLVYRVEALCNNDGSLKQGMPLEVVFH